MNRNALLALGFLSFLAVLSLCLSVPAPAAETAPQERLSLAEKAGYHISFLYYLKACFVPMLITVVLASFYLVFFMM